MTEVANNVAERFMRYVQVDTQSDPASTTFPSTEKQRSEEHTSELQSRSDLVCRLLLEKKKK